MKPDVGHIRTFGCVVRVMLPSEKLPLPMSASMAIFCLMVAFSYSLSLQAAVEIGRFLCGAGGLVSNVLGDALGGTR